MKDLFQTLLNTLTKFHLNPTIVLASPAVKA